MLDLWRRNAVNERNAVKDVVVEGMVWMPHEDEVDGVD